MITESDKNILIDCDKKFGVSALYLFGSSTTNEMSPQDIDVGVKGVPPEKFFSFYAQLLRRLSIPVDVVDMTKPSMFVGIIEETGMRIYG